MTNVTGNEPKEIMPDEVKRSIEQGEQVHIIDVREPEEWTAGHIPGAKLIPLGFIPFRYTELDPDKEYVIVCRSGHRSGLACEQLQALGYKAVNMAGGMLEWDGEVSYED